MSQNVVDQWMALLGIERQLELAQVTKRSKARPSQWRSDNAIPFDVILNLQRLARSRGVEVPDHLIERQRRRPASNEAA